MAPGPPSTVTARFTNSALGRALAGIGALRYFQPWMADDVAGTVKQAKPAQGSFFTRSLSARLLGFTIAFVLLAEILIFGPSLGAFQRMWLQDRVNAAQIAALALEAAPEAGLTEDLRRELLENAEVSRVAMKRDGARELRLDDTDAGAPPHPMRTFDLRERSMLTHALAAFETLFSPAGGEIRVLATPRFETGEFIEIVIADAALKRDMTVYAWRMLSGTLILSLIVGVLLYATLHVLFVRPMRKLTSQIEQFGARPNDITAAIQPSGRADEIGRAERALAAMETEVRGALRQRERLAGLGAAVAKLAHDLRNSLATASLVTERLAESDDPRVKQTAPRLVRAIARAAALAEAALRYGRAEEPAPQLEFVGLREALDEAAAEALDGYPLVAWRNRAPDDLKINVDPEHAHRIFANLMRNAAQAMGANGGALEARLARRDDARAVIELCDTGPGLSKAAQERLFEPFARANGNGGSGLGLSIARELARGMGGDLELVSSSSGGAIFAIALRTAPALAKAP